MTSDRPHPQRPSAGSAGHPPSLALLSGARTTGAFIGDEPPMPIEAQPGSATPHAVNLRWLAGTLLAGVVGMALVGASLLVALDGQATFAARAKIAILHSPASGDDAAEARGDKIVTDEDFGAAAQVAHLPDTVKIGDREIIKTRVFTRVTSAISLGAPSVADEIPPYNPLQIVASAANAVKPADDPSADSNANVSMTKHDLSSADYAYLRFSPAGLTDDEIGSSLVPAPLPLLTPAPSLAYPVVPLNHGLASANSDPALLAYASATLGPFSAIDVKVVPENVAVIRELPERAGKFGGTDRPIIVKHGESFEQILKANGANTSQIDEIQRIFSPKTHDYSVSAGQKLKLLVGGNGVAHQPDRLLRVVTYADNQVGAIAAVDDAGTFHAVVPPAKGAKVTTRTAKSEDDEDDDEGGPSLYEGLYTTALKNGMPRPLIDELVRIFAYDVDFQRKAQSGDAFDVLYVKDEDSTNADRAEILYASLTTGDEVRKFYRYQTHDDGLIDYFDEQGKSAKKFLLRKPMSGGRFTSAFGYRFHPILGYGRMHTGVDWADAVGTPVVAAGNGVVLKASWDTGYGNRIEIQHTNGYVTTYNHLSAVAKGLAPGIHVRQGQVIGFLGSTGLSTGPHLHYEVIVNGHFVDPLAIKLPRGRELEGKMLADFDRERQHDDAILARMADPTRIAENP